MTEREKAQDLVRRAVANGETDPRDVIEKVVGQGVSRREAPGAIRDLVDYGDLRFDERMRLLAVPAETLLGKTPSGL